MTMNNTYFRYSIEINGTCPTYDQIESLVPAMWQIVCWKFDQRYSEADGIEVSRYEYHGTHPEVANVMELMHQALMAAA